PDQHDVPAGNAAGAGDRGAGDPEPRRLCDFVRVGGRGRSGLGGARAADQERALGARTTAGQRGQGDWRPARFLCAGYPPTEKQPFWEPGHYLGVSTMEEADWLHDETRSFKL